ncbi:hypothetical protein SAMN04515647_1155 [Cohaesibacter sp. ES.047]|uniref:tetratricopeptide repeat protein n=1 Tax=Cohaesibacter sp. ES.047 TaxID=1798205 RepID=UPI000BC0AAE6|nr:tetratricopeptide repeat protein [Cohaesibacter sp. ES.047]SNY90964.1 hypothetical protein SAMN04515647_1155 [Cohaesibacter sp. ES.047]
MKVRLIDHQCDCLGLIRTGLVGSILAFAPILGAQPAGAAEAGPADTGKVTNTIEIAPGDAPQDKEIAPHKERETLPQPTTRDNPFNVPRLELTREAAYSAYQRGYYLTAFDFATRLAGQGDVAAQTLLGELYYRGLGVERDVKEAASWFELAAAEKDAEAEFALGLLYARGQGVDKNTDKAIELFEKAAAQGQKHAQFNLGLIKLEGQLARQDLNEAIDLLTQSANQGLADAQYTLANIYRSQLFPTPELDKAAYWMLQAAKSGFADAQLEYGLMLFSGKGVAKNYDMSRAWIEQAAKSGHVLAQNRLARMLARGYGAPADPVKAAEYYLLSKRAGKHDDWLENFFTQLPDADKQKALADLSDKSLW